MKPIWLERHTVYAPYLTLCLTEEEYLAAAKHCKLNYPTDWLDPQHRAATHTWDKGGKLVCVVCLRQHPDDDGIEVATTLVHEAVHVFQRLCDSIGEREPSREFEAYSIERIAGELMREYARRMK